MADRKRVDSSRLGACQRQRSQSPNLLHRQPAKKRGEKKRCQSEKFQKWGHEFSTNTLPESIISEARVLLFFLKRQRRRVKLTSDC